MPGVIVQSLQGHKNKPLVCHNGANLSACFSQVRDPESEPSPGHLRAGGFNGLDMFLFQLELGQLPPIALMGTSLRTYPRPLLLHSLACIMLSLGLVLQPEPHFLCTLPFSEVHPEPMKQ